MPNMQKSCFALSILVLGLATPGLFACGTNSAILGSTSLLQRPALMLPAPTATPGLIAEYSVPTAASEPFAITKGPDGDLWFTENAANNVAKITTSGMIAQFAGPLVNGDQFHALNGITTGPDGTLWFTQVSWSCFTFKGHRICYGNGKVSNITTGGTLDHQYKLPALSDPFGIVMGPDRNLWFTSGTGIYKLTTSGGLTRYSLPTVAPVVYAYNIAVGHDGNLWVTTRGGCSYTILRVTLAGVIMTFSTGGESLGGGSSPDGIVAGPDGNIWFTEANFCSSGPSAIGRITPTGKVTHFLTPTANSVPTSIVTGSDGNLWFTENAANKIGRITPKGVITEY